ncbi:MAG: ABC transporter permease [Bauldia sp.]|nr:ABC transporter permease [Bauldia sp.]
MSTTPLPQSTAAAAAPLTRLIGIARSRSSLLYPLVALAVLIIWFSIASPYFFTLGNMFNIGRGSAVLLLVALAGTVVIIIGSIDLSVAGTVTLTGVICALLIDRAGLLVAVVAAIGVGGLVGAANGLLVQWLRIPSFLVTLGMLSITIGIAQAVNNNAPVQFRNRELGRIVNGELWGIPTVVILPLVVLAIVTFAAYRTRAGRYMYAIGGGEAVAAASGVPAFRYKVIAFVLSGVLCGLAGVVVTGQIGAGTLDVGGALLLDSVAAVVMGGTALSGGVGGPQRTLLGVLVIAVLGNGMGILGFTNYTQSIIKGVVIIFAVALSIDRKKYGIIK